MPQLSPYISLFDSKDMELFGGEEGWSWVSQARWSCMLKFNTAEKLPKNPRGSRIVFQPPFFGVELLSFGGDHSLAVRWFFSVWCPLPETPVIPYINQCFWEKKDETSMTLPCSKMFKNKGFQSEKSYDLYNHLSTWNSLTCPRSCHNNKP